MTKEQLEALFAEPEQPAAEQPQGEARRWSPVFAGYGIARVVDQFGTPHTRDNGEVWSGTFEEAREIARELNRKQAT